MARVRIIEYDSQWVNTEDDGDWEWNPSLCFGSFHTAEPWVNSAWHIDWALDKIGWPKDERQHLQVHETPNTLLVLAGPYGMPVLELIHE